MKNQVQLITYVDRLGGGTLQDLGVLLHNQLRGLFGGVHLLPFFTPIDGADAGFDPTDHTQVDPRLGSWHDLKALGTDLDLMADLIANHMSSQSPQFIDYLEKGEASAWAGLFLTRERVFPDGGSEAELQAIYRPRPGLPFTKMHLGDGQHQQFWTTFTAGQIDIDVTHPLGKDYLEGILRTFAANGVDMVRLDAVGYTIKKPGTSCFMLPETFEYIADLSHFVGSLGMQVLVEIHAHYQTQIEIARRVDWVYDFALPPLVLHAFTFATALPLKHWLQIRPANTLTVLDTHDGIGIIDIGADGDAAGLVPPAELDLLVEAIHRNSNDESRLATGAAASNLDLYQVNCTYFDALGRNALRYLLARAIQFFIPGIPQVYYVGLLAGENDMDLLKRSGVGRDINRHYYSSDEITMELERPVVRDLCMLIRLRNSHPAFQGTFSMPDCPQDTLRLHWQHGTDTAELMICFRDDSYQLRISEAGGMRSLVLLQDI